MCCIILEQVPYQKVGTYIGFGALVSAAAPALGPTYGGVITTAFGWKNIFLVLIPVLIFTLVLGLVTIREHAKPQKTPVDVGGIAFGNTMTTAMMRLPVELKAYGNTSLNTLMQFAGAVGTSVCAACVAFAQAGTNASDTVAFAESTKKGSLVGFIFLLR